MWERKFRYWQNTLISVSVHIAKSKVHVSVKHKVYSLKCMNLDKDESEQVTVNNEQGEI